MNIIKSLSEPEEKRILRTARDTKGKKAERDYMIMFLCLNTGLRLEELLQLNVGDIRNKEKLHVRPETTKATRKGNNGKKKAVGRVVPLNTKLQAALKHFIKLKLTWRESIADDAPLFVSRKGSRLLRRSLQDMFEDWRAKAGLPDYFTFHSMRHTFAKRFLQRSQNPYQALPALQKLLGHASLASTGVYLEPDMAEMEAGVEAL